MTIEETRALMLSIDELREIYEQVQRTGEVRRLYLLEGDNEKGLETHINPECEFGHFVAAEDRLPLVFAGEHRRECDKTYARSGTGWHGLQFLSWACFRSREDAEAWEIATLGGLGLLPASFRDDYKEASV